VTSDSFVVGLDLTTGQEAYIRDASVDHWRAKSYRRGDHTLVCLHCYSGFGAPVGTRTALVVKYREGGFRRAHFSHPPGQAPNGGHSPETLWHAESKHVLAHWARTQPEVSSAEPERYLPDGVRRADVDVGFHDGSRLGIELQSRLLTDQDWEHRHADYARNGIADLWLWRPTCPVPWIVAKNRANIWYFDLSARRLGMIVGQPHVRPADWLEHGDLHRYAQHVPPCVRDEYRYYRWLPDELALTSGGLQAPATFMERIHRDQQAVVEAAATARATAQQRFSQSSPSVAGVSRRRPPTLPAPRRPPDPVRHDALPPEDHAPPTSAVKQSSPTPARCDICHMPLADIIAHLGRHLDCDQQLAKRQRPRRR
jgi:hypothetical protein